MLTGKDWRSVGELASLGLSFVLAIVMGTALGWWVDERLGTAPWGFIVFFACGVAAGILNVYRITARALRDTRPK
ncbi:MAG: AtpZ/AtpI family protein [Vicinamibacteraceae bacterium]